VFRSGRMRNTKSDRALVESMARQAWCGWGLAYSWTGVAPVPPYTIPSSVNDCP
jgi:hypothetical protein